MEPKAETTAVPLGDRVIMAQPEVNGSQLEHGEEVGGVLLIARGEAPEVSDAVEEAARCGCARDRAPG
jgi:hypothetical protein